MTDKPKLNIIISQATADLARHLGAPIPRGVTIFQGSPRRIKTDAVVVRRWTDPPIMPDNIRSQCSMCHAMTQERPDNPHGMRICEYCITDFTNAPRH